MSRKNWTLTAVILGSGIVFLDTTLVNVALPRIGEELDSSVFETLEAQSYVYYGYLLTLSSLLILAGGLTDYLGRRKMFAVGLASFGVVSFLCGLAPNLEALVALRLLQGAAGALLVPGSLSIITATFQGEEQGRAFGVWAGASGLTTIMGPVVGGALVSYVSWRWAFFVNVPLVAVALWATLKHVDESRDEASTGRFDRVGAVVVATAVGGLTFGAIRGEAQGWSDPSALIALALGAVATVYLPFQMKRAENPLVPPSLFSSRNFTVTNISTLIIYGALYVNFQYLALFLVGTIGYNELAFGLAGLPGPLLLVLLSTRFGTLAARYGPRWFMTAGPAIMGLGLLWLTRFPSDSGAWAPEGSSLDALVPPAGYWTDVFPALLVFGIGLSIMVAPLTTALMRSVPVRHSGVASAVNNAISRVGPQLVGAVLFIAISSTFYASLAADVPDRDRSVLQETMSPLNPPPEGTDASEAQAVQDASTEAFRLAMLVSALLCFAGAAVNGVGIRNELLHDAPQASAEGVPSPA